MTSSLPGLLALGFFLGIRHATDADHVIAVTTVVCRQRGLRGAAVIGARWGLGHTATILVVGGAIILFDVAVPPRVGFCLEMAVAGMLILLGALNLWGRAHPAGDLAHLHTSMSQPVGWRPLAIGASVITSKAAIRDRVKTGHTRSDRDRII